MIAICQHTRSGSLADHQRGRFQDLDEQFNLTIGRSYIVVGMGIWETVLQLLVKDDRGLPAWCPAALFELNDQSLPADWRFVFRDGIRCSGSELFTRWVAQWGYEQLVSDEGHANALMEREPQALEIFQSEHARLASEFE